MALAHKGRCMGLGSEIWLLVAPLSPTGFIPEVGAIILAPPMLGAVTTLNLLGTQVRTEAASPP